MRLEDALKKIRGSTGDKIECYFLKHPNEVCSPAELSVKLKLPISTVPSALKRLQSKSRLERYTPSSSISFYGYKEAIEELKKKARERSGFA